MCGVYEKSCVVCMHFCAACMQFCVVCMQFCGVCMQFCGVGSFLWCLYAVFCGVCMHICVVLYAVFVGCVCTFLAGACTQCPDDVMARELK